MKNKKRPRKVENPVKPHKNKGIVFENEKSQGKEDTGEEKITEINQPCVGGIPNLATKGKTDKNG